MAPISTRSRRTSSKLEEDEDGVNGDRMKSLESVCLGRKPLMPLAECGSSRPKRAADDSGKENVAPAKKKQASPLVSGVTKFLETTENEGGGALDLLLLALKDETKSPLSHVDERRVEADALKRYTRLRSSLVNKKRAGDKEEGSTLAASVVEEEDEKSEEFTVCLTSTQDIQELPLLDKAEASNAKEDVAEVHRSNECEQDVSLRLSVGVKQEVEVLQEARLSLEETRRLLRSSSRKDDKDPLSDSSAGAPTFPTAAVKVSASWLDLLQNDLKGRLAALKRSRRNVRGVLLSGQFWKRGGSKLDVRDELDKWKSMFQTMDAGLAAEGAKLEYRLRQVQEMQKHCLSEAEVESSSRRVSHVPNQPSALFRNVALAASAAAICSTANFGLRNNNNNSTTN